MNGVDERRIFGCRASIRLYVGGVTLFAALSGVFVASTFTMQGPTAEVKNALTYNVYMCVFVCVCVPSPCRDLQLK